MTRRGLLAAVSALAGVIGVSAALYAQQTVSRDVLRRAGGTNDALPGSWLSYGRNQSETRYSTLTQIDAGNAKTLGLSWSYVMGAGGGNQEATPIVWDDTLYGMTTWSVVFALDARTGKELWQSDPEANRSSSACCGVVNRGIALYEGKVIAPVIDGRMRALENAATRMDFDISVDIAASPEVVWAVMSDAERWHEWTESVRGIRLLDKGPLRVGSRALIRQPRFPPAVWKVVELDPGRSFTWKTGSPGMRVYGRHSVNNRRLARQPPPSLRRRARRDPRAAHARHHEPLSGVRGRRAEESE